MIFGISASGATVGAPTHNLILGDERVIYEHNTIGQTAGRYVSVRQNLGITGVSDANGYNTTSERKEQLKRQIAEISNKYGLDADKMIRIAKCESSLNEVIYGDDGKAFGIYQFWRTTFDLYCAGDYYNSDDQIECAGKMFSKGLSSHWSCK